ncbi:MAG: HAD-IA family hydrolase [Micropruina sp.]|nr:HAD-IA family hydrolase [Micropruina sp.]
MSEHALILDCDGVLADTEKDGHLVAFNQVFEEAGYPFRWSEDEYADLLKVGGGKERMRHYLSLHPELELPGSDDLDSLLAEVHRRKSYDYQQIVNSGRIPGRPGVRRLVEDALDHGWRVAIASTSAVSSVEAVAVAVFGQATRDRLFGIYGGDIVQAKKPAPDIYLYALEQLGLRPDQAVVVEDSESGAKAAEAAGIKHIVTVSHFTVDDPFPAASVVVGDLGEPGAPAQVLAGEDVRDADGLISYESLQRILGDDA